jgi:hypothetical protein
VSDAPDFDKLRAERDAAITRIVQEAARSLWGDEAAEKVVAAHVNYGGGSPSCYCACADGGPCEHVFTGWRDFEDGCGGETFCEKCGTGAMSHDMHVNW